MSEKLLTLEEAAEYLGLTESAVNNLVEHRVISAYKMGSEAWLFRKEHLDAIRAEILSRLAQSGIKPEQAAHHRMHHKKKEKLAGLGKVEEVDGFKDKLADFFYFNDFYIISGIIAAVLLVFIFRGL